MLRALCVFLLVPLLSQSQQAADEISKGMDWLTRYGYLSPPDHLSGQLQTMQDLTDAVKSMQRFAGLRETGQLDQETLEMMKRPRCSLPDMIGTSEIMRRRRKRYALAGTVWNKKSLSWRVKSFPTRPGWQPDHVTSLLAAALHVWSKVSTLDFYRVEGEADINIEFTRSNHNDGYPFDGIGGTLAHAYFPGEHPISGDTHFDDDEEWNYRGRDGTDLFTVAVHEFGHAIGLSHSSAGDSIMRPYYQGPVGDAEHYQLPQDDVRGAQHLYGKRAGDPAGEEPGFKPNIPDVPRPSEGPRPDGIDRCDTNFDSVANIRGEAFFFKDHYFWRMQRAGNLVSLNPAQIGNFWQGLPEDLTRIDSVYERLIDNKIIFFIGQLYWLFSNTQVEEGYPRDISDFGLPVPRVDAVFVWPHNGKTYFFSGKHFWRFDEKQSGMDPGYPKEISLWKGIPSDLDGVMSWSDGSTYFFKDGGYWRMEGGGVEVESTIGRSTHRDWLHCDVPTVAPRHPEGQDPRERGRCSCPFERNAATSLGLARLLAALLLGCVAWHLLLGA